VPIDPITLAEWAAASQAILFVSKAPGSTLEAGKVNLLDTSGGPAAFILPDPAVTRDPVVAKRVGVGDATISVGGGTIDGAATNVLVVDQEACTYTPLAPDYRATAGFGTPTAPTAHASTHESGGSDEISVAGLTGLLATPQTPTAHASTHESGGSDELAVTALGGFPGGTTDFLRADGSFAAPAGGGGGSSFFMFGARAIGTSVSTRYLFPSYADALAHLSPVQLEVPAGTPAFSAVRINVRHNNPSPGGTETITYTLRVNGVATALAVTVLQTAASGSASAVVAIPAGALVDIEVTKSGGLGNAPDDVVCLVELA